MSKRTAWGILFPGQGSQYVGMGKGLAERYAAAAETFREADEILELPLSRIAWEGPEEELIQTKNAQPAILVHSVAVLRALAEGAPAAAVAAGHSLGEFSAHVAQGTLSFPEALRAVRLRGELMFQAGEARPGTMAAILGLDDEVVEALCEEVSQEDSVCVPANLNAPGQVVVSGDLSAVSRARDRAKGEGARKVIPLTVSGAFHSPLMKPAEDGLRSFLEGVEFADPKVPVISNVTGRSVRSGSEARELLIRQLTAPVRWRASVEAMLEQGAQSFVEVGPGRVLCGLNRRNARGWDCQTLGEADEVETWLQDGAAH